MTSRRSGSGHEPGDRPRVSVIVPARNARSHLEKLVPALSVQTLPRSDFELVVADDGSSDGSVEWIEQMGADWIRLAPGVPINSYAARNRAVAASVGEILAFCDADCVPEPDWLERGIAALALCDVVAGRIRFIVPERRTVWTLLDMDSSKDHEREVRNKTAETANLFLRRELFDRLGGFEQTIPEFGDFDFAQRAVAAGAELMYADDVLVWHPTRNRGRDFLRAQWIYSHGYGACEGRAGRRPDDVSIKALIPIVRVVRSRRWWGRSIGPDRRWLGENGVVATPMETLKALPLMYLVVPYLRIVAQFRGWLDGRRLRRDPTADAAA